MVFLNSFFNAIENNKKPVNLELVFLAHLLTAFTFEKEIYLIFMVRFQIKTVMG